MRSKGFLACLLALLLCAPALASGEESVPNSALPMPKFMKNVAVHDPSIIKADDGFYYIYGLSLIHI